MPAQRSCGTNSQSGERKQQAPSTEHRAQSEQSAVKPKACFSIRTQPKVDVFRPTPALRGGESPKPALESQIDMSMVMSHVHVPLIDH